MIGFIFGIFFKIVTGKKIRPEQKEMFRFANGSKCSTQGHPRGDGASELAVVYTLWNLLWFDRRVLFLGSDYSINMLFELKDKADMAWRGEIFAASYVKENLKGKEFDLIIVENEDIPSEEYLPFLYNCEKYSIIYSK